ncbi:hypothetical protein BG846_01713 [Streptomyces fradiae ATCC 10745 = DSM 40063]|uniref:Uncharacterized protein n=1 Tax=Streptomyces fradiae ATCC 10745 = DSM 40063 TaxID=1319510 RepID=A0A1Y2NYL4_STRFR|nr:hypothetical protein BG846_01713 [Streptomyces fradiae ATCC 10745 = DSM 40063]
MVGHTDLTTETLTLVEAELSARLLREADGAKGVVRVGAGVPVAAGRAARRAGRPLVVLLPAQGSVPAVLPYRDRHAAGELLLLAEQMRLMPYDPEGRDACVAADERMITTSRRLLAVWDGSPSNGRDATAHLVAFARARGIPVDVVWPAGATRRTPATAPASVTVAASAAPRRTPAASAAGGGRRPGGPGPGAAGSGASGPGGPRPGGQPRMPRS